MGDEGRLDPWVEEWMRTNAELVRPMEELVPELLERAVEEVCYAGQPHAFVNLAFPAGEAACATIGDWVRATFATAA